MYLESSEQIFKGHEYEWNSFTPFSGVPLVDVDDIRVSCGYALKMKNEWLEPKGSCSLDIEQAQISKESPTLILHTLI